MKTSDFIIVGAQQVRATILFEYLSSSRELPGVIARRKSGIVLLG